MRLSRKIILFLMLLVGNFCGPITLTSLTTFYPTEARRKGMNQSETETVLDIVSIAMCISAFVFGKFMTNIGSKSMFTMSHATIGVTAICFGFLNYLPSPRLFFWASVLIRSLQVVAYAAFIVSSSVIAAKLFPRNVALVVGIMETAIGLGYAAGPLIGGFLYEYGGFQASFWLLGGILLLISILAFFTVELPEDMDEVNAERREMLLRVEPLRERIWRFFKFLFVALMLLSLFDSKFEAHLRKFSHLPAQVGQILWVYGAFRTLSASICGVFIDKFNYSASRGFFLCGSNLFSVIIALVALVLASWGPIDKNFAWIGLTFVAMVDGVLPTMMFQECFEYFKSRGYNNSTYTYGYASGIVQCLLALAGSIAPNLARVGTELLGFETT